MRSIVRPIESTRIDTPNWSSGVKRPPSLLPHTSWVIMVGAKGSKTFRCSRFWQTLKRPGGGQQTLSPVSACGGQLRDDHLEGPSKHLQNRVADFIRWAMFGYAEQEIHHTHNPCPPCSTKQFEGLTVEQRCCPAY